MAVCVLRLLISVIKLTFNLNCMVDWSHFLWLNLFSMLYVRCPLDVLHMHIRSVINMGIKSFTNMGHKCFRCASGTWSGPVECMWQQAWRSSPSSRRLAPAEPAAAWDPLRGMISRLFFNSTLLNAAQTLSDIFHNSHIQGNVSNNRFFFVVD